MGNNLIHNYLNNTNNTQAQTKETKGTFRLPTISSTISNFDTETDKLIKPLDGKGYLVNSDLVHMPKEIIRDGAYTTKALADGVRGKANDHQLGKLNDLGLKLGGIAIATYLMTQKATPKTKAMEFIGFGAFLASMALWPKVALELPARIIHGFNFRKQYVDDQGRKKFVSLDPNYIPFDLYKGDKKDEDLDIIGDRLGIPRNITNRNDVIKEQMRKISVQNNTLWMLTAGIATPIMTALGCNVAERYLTPAFEKMENNKTNNMIDKAHAYLEKNMTPQEAQAYEKEILKLEEHNANNSFTKLVESMKGKIVKTDDISKLADTLADGFDAEMKDAAKLDIINTLGNQKNIINSTSAKNIAQSITSAISKTDSALASNITTESIEHAASQGYIRGAVKDLLEATGLYLALNDTTGANNRVSANFKTKQLDAIDFFKITEETKGMTPAERLAHNIKSVILKVNNSNPSEDFIPGMSELELRDKSLKMTIDSKLSKEADTIAQRFYEGELHISTKQEKYVTDSVSKLFKSKAPRGPKYDTLFTQIRGIVTGETTSKQGYFLSQRKAQTLIEAGKSIKKYNIMDSILSKAAHFKTEKANETLVANNWEKVSNLLVKELKITDKELKTLGKNKGLTLEFFTQRLEQVCSNKENYESLMKNLASIMAELDEKLEAPGKSSTGRMMGKLSSGIEHNCTSAGETLKGLNMTEMEKKMVSSMSSRMGVNTGSILNSKLQRLSSRVEGVQSSYMRLLQTCEFFHRSAGYEQELAAGGDIAVIAKKYGFTDNPETNKELIRSGKQLLMSSHTNSFYNKMGIRNNPDFFKTLMWSVYRPNYESSANWDKAWNEATEKTVSMLDDIKVNGEVPRRALSNVERKPIGQTLKEYMNKMFNSMGLIERKIIETGDPLRIADGSVSAADARAIKRFDLLGKAPSELLHDALKSKSGAKKWIKTFAPILGVTFGATILAQFFFGKKDSNMKA